MSVNEIRNMGHSVNARLKQLASERKVSFDYLLLRYAYERFLFRLGCSIHAEDFILKGAGAFSIWFGPMFRVTRDTDLLGHGNPSQERLIQCFHDICKTSVPEDGVVFDVSSLVVEDIKKDAKYKGTRIMLTAWIHNARTIMQFDIGFGDSIFPEAERQSYPVLLGNFPSPSIFVYPRYTVIAEKFEAIVSLGMLNSRLKDYFDLWLLSEEFEFDFALLRQAVERTFKRRNNSIPENLPIGLTADFYNDPMKQSQWRAFLKKVNPAKKPESLEEAVTRIRTFLTPILAGENTSFETWKAGDDWH